MASLIEEKDAPKRPLRKTPSLPAVPTLAPAGESGRAADVLERQISDSAALTEAAEEILFRWTRGGTRTATEERILGQVFGRRDEIQSNLGRAKRVLRLREQCGGPEELAKRRDAEVVARERADRELPAIKQKMAELAEMEKAISQAVIDTVSATDAAYKVREGLLENCPPDVRRDVSFEVANIKERHREVLTLQQEIAWRNGLATTMQRADRAVHIQSRVRNNDQASLPQLDENGNIVDLEWARYVSRRQQEAAEMQARLVDLKHALDDELAAASAPLEKYWLAPPP